MAMGQGIDLATAAQLQRSGSGASGGIHEVARQVLQGQGPNAEEELRRQREQAEADRRAREEAINNRLGALQTREGELRGSFNQAQGSFNTAVDNQLAGLLQDTGIQFDSARGEAGAALANRGLLRSTAANRAIGDINLEQQRQQAPLRLQAEEQKSALKSSGEGLLNRIKQQREQASASRDIQALQQAESTIAGIDENLLKTNFQTELANAKLKSQDQNFYTEMIGGFLGSAAKLFIGG